MKARSLPETDSIQELGQFWDTHELTDFEGHLEEVTEPVFDRGEVIPLHLEAPDAEAVRKIAESKGLADAELIRSWIIEKLRSA